MKTLLLILATAGIAFGSAYYVVNASQSAAAKRDLAAAQAKFNAEKAALETALAEAKGQPMSAPSVTAIPAAAPGKARLSAKEILEKLVAIRPGSGAQRNRNIRQVVYYLESLADCGQEAVPVISEFFAQNQDIDYTTEDVSPDAAAAPQDQNGRNGRNGNNRGNNNGIWSFRRGGELRTDFVLPPSLRLGLVDVLKTVGGETAEKTLASLLETSGRGIEIDYVAKVLQEMAPDKYRDLALTAAKDLLTHPPAIDSPNRLDELSEGYLFDVLKMYNDTSFAAAAQNMLIGADGRIDRNALNYLNSVLKEQAVPTLYAVYMNANLTNQFEKMQIGRDILGHVGNNPTANKLLTDVVNDPNGDNRIKMMAIASVGGFNFGPGGGNNDATDAASFAARVPVLQNLRATATDEQMQGMLDAAIANASSRATNGPQVNFNPGRIFGRNNGGGGNGGGNNQRRNRNGNNNNGAAAGDTAL